MACDVIPFKETIVFLKMYVIMSNPYKCSILIQSRLIHLTKRNSRRVNSKPIQIIVHIIHSIKGQPAIKICVRFQIRLTNQFDFTGRILHHEVNETITI